MSEQPKNGFAWTLMVLSLLAGAFGVVLFAELGQLLNLPSSWLYAVHPNLGWISVVLVIIALFVRYLHFRNRLLGRRMAIAYTIVLLGMVFVANYFVPYIWLRGHHHTAEFISVSEADALLEDDADVFVLEIGGKRGPIPATG